MGVSILTHAVTVVIWLAPALTDVAVFLFCSGTSDAEESFVAEARSAPNSGSSAMPSLTEAEAASVHSDDDEASEGAATGKRHKSHCVEGHSATAWLLSHGLLCCLFLSEQQRQA